MLRRWCVGAALLLRTNRMEASPCERLADLKLERVTIVASGVVPAGELKLPVPVRSASPELFDDFKRLAAFCRVQTIARPTAGSEIAIETWLPLTDWNGRYLGVGNGGYAGSVNYHRLGESLLAGYAVSSTDTGHRGGARDATWAAGDSVKQIDFDYRAVHEAAVVSKALIRAFYGRSERASYFSSCSNGGRQGLMEAERYPGDYDGIFAGAPALNLGFTARVSGNFDAFAQRGGKIIVYHGMNDAPAGSIALYEKLLRDMGEERVRDFFQLYLIPGMGHCGSGTEPNDIGQWVRPNADRQHSLLKALESWVEAGRRPRGVIATRFVIDGDATSGEARTRVLCPYSSVCAAKGCVRPVVKPYGRDATSISRRADGVGGAALHYQLSPPLRPRAPMASKCAGRSRGSRVPFRNLTISAFLRILR